jgi:hypothetical protein
VTGIDYIKLNGNARTIYIQTYIVNSDIGNIKPRSFTSDEGFLCDFGGFLGRISLVFDRFISPLHFDNLIGNRLIGLVSEKNGEED